MLKKFEKYIAMQYDKKDKNIVFNNTSFTTFSFFLNGKPMCGKGISENGYYIINDILKHHGINSYFKFIDPILDDFNKIIKMVKTSNKVPYFFSVDPVIEVHYKANFDSLVDVDRIVIIHRPNSKNRFKHVINLKNDNHYYKETVEYSPLNPVLENYRETLFIHGKNNYQYAICDFIKYHLVEFEGIGFVFDPDDEETVKNVYNVIEMITI